MSHQVAHKTTAAPELLLSTTSDHVGLVQPRRPAADTWSHAAAKFVGIAAAYLAVGMSGLLLALGFGRQQIIWSPMGVALGALILFGPRYWPAIALTDYLLSVAAGCSVRTSLCILGGNVVAPVIGAVIYRRYSGRRRNFRTVDDVFAFVLAAALACFISASFGAAGIDAPSAAAGLSHWRLFQNWWLGDLISCLILAPLVLNIASLPFRGWPARRWAEAFALLGCMGGVAYFVFTHKLVLNEVQIPFTVPLFPFIIWGALRFEQTGAAVVALLISVPSLLATVYQAGPFVHQEFYRALLTVHAYMFVITLSSYCLGAAVTGRCSAEERSRNLSEELRALSQKIEVAREEERVHLAREIHDQLGQQLTALGLALAAVRRRVPEENEAAVAKTREMEEILQATLGTVQRIATELRPGVINELSLPDALHWLCENFEREADIRVDFKCEVEELPLDQHSKIAVFRIFQEAFANIARHAQASRVTMQIAREHTLTIFSLQDDGIGIPASARASHQSLGIIGMRERAHAVGAELRISESREAARSADRPGTCIEVRIPMTRASK